MAGTISDELNKIVKGGGAPGPERIGKAHLRKRAGVAYAKVLRSEHASCICTLSRREVEPGQGKYR